MPNTSEIVINTSPLIAIVAAMGGFNVLQSLYTNVIVPFEVSQEILIGGTTGLGVTEFQADIGEASVIQLALNKNISTVCIDEAVGRRIARLSGLAVTGSIGILLRAKKEGYSLSIKTAIEKMLNHNIRLSQRVIDFALKESGEF